MKFGVLLALPLVLGTAVSSDDWEEKYGSLLISSANIFHVNRVERYKSNPKDAAAKPTDPFVAYFPKAKFIWLKDSSVLADDFGDKSNPIHFMVPDETVAGDQRLGDLLERALIGFKKVDKDATHLSIDVDNFIGTGQFMGYNPPEEALATLRYNDAAVTTPANRVETSKVKTAADTATTTPVSWTLQVMNYGKIVPKDPKPVDPKAEKPKEGEAPQPAPVEPPNIAYSGVSEYSIGMLWGHPEQIMGSINKLLLPTEKGRLKIDQLMDKNMEIAKHIDPAKVYAMHFDKIVLSLNVKRAYGATGTDEAVGDALYPLFVSRPRGAELGYMMYSTWVDREEEKKLDNDTAPQPKKEAGSGPPGKMLKMIAIRTRFTPGIAKDGKLSFNVPAECVFTHLLRANYISAIPDLQKRKPPYSKTKGYILDPKGQDPKNPDLKLYYHQFTDVPMVDPLGEQVAPYKADTVVSKIQLIPSRAISYSLTFATAKDPTDQAAPPIPEKVVVYDEFCNEKLQTAAVLKKKK